MYLVSLAATDFRNLVDTTIEPDPEGTTVITGSNGAGKTSLLEAAAYLATLQSFRGSPREALVRRGAERAILRAESRVGDRTLTIEAEITVAGRSRTQVNRQPVRRRADLHEALRVTVFSPEDIGVVRSGPAHRRRFLDETLAVVDPKAARAAEEAEKVLRQRAALLRTAGQIPEGRDGHDARRMGRPPGRGRHPPGGGAGAPRRRAGASGLRALLATGRVSRRTSDWPTAGHGPGPCSRPSPAPAPRTSDGACRRWAPTGTSSS